MKAAVVTAPGHVDVEEVPDPTPGPREVVVAVRGSGVCGTDLHILGGEFAPRLPIVPGHEFAGEVVAVGSAVDGIALGAAVAVDPSLPCHECHYCRRGRENLCERWAAIGVTAPGGAAEYALAPVGNCVRVPEGAAVADYALVEPVACVVNAFDSLPRRPGEHYLVYGAGTMGILLAAMAERVGAASVTLVEPRAERREQASGLVAAATVAHAEEAQGPRGWDVVIDATGVPAAIEDGLGRVMRGGTFLHFGVPGEQDVASYSPFRVYNHEITITGSMSVLHSFERAADLLAAGLVDPARLVTTRLPLERYADALEHVRAGTGLKTQVVIEGTA